MVEDENEIMSPEEKKKKKRSLAAIRGHMTRRRKKQEWKEKFQRETQEYFQRRREQRQARLEAEERRHQEYMFRRRAAIRGWETRKRRAMERLRTEQSSAIESGVNALDEAYGGSNLAPVQVVNEFLTQFVSSCGEKLSLTQEEVDRRLNAQRQAIIEDFDGNWTPDEDWLNRI